MKVSQATSTKEQRVKYIRALERFLNSTMGALKIENFSLDLFKKRVEKSLKTLYKVETTRLDSTYTTRLESYVKTVIKVLQDENLDDSTKHKTLLKEGNLIEKERYQSSYKKSKYTQADFNDGY